MKKILFLSALDFKEKSIQVIRKTPEAYVKAGWEVDYVVARDNCPNGNYYYEKEINPEGLRVRRFYWPFPRLRSTNMRYIGLALSKLSSLIVIIRLFLKAVSLIRNNKYDVIYGYELQGVLAMNLIKFFFARNVKTVSRFQGTFLNEMFVNKQYLRIMFNLDLIFAIWLNSDLIIMTDDGTQGDQAVKKIKGNKPYNMVFWTNGVDLLPENPVQEYERQNKLIFMSVSRLVSWKKVDRNLYILKEFLELGYSDFHYYVIGEGEQRKNLESLSVSLGLDNKVTFVGGLKHSSVMNYLINADIFLSMYDSSNVGNPLLEAIRANKIIITLANGDTPKWIKHKVNGLIYDPCDLNFYNIAQDIKKLIDDDTLKNKILRNIKTLEEEKVCTWCERLDKEIKYVNEL